MFVLRMLVNLDDVACRIIFSTPGHFGLCFFSILKGKTPRMFFFLSWVTNTCLISSLEERKFPPTPANSLGVSVYNFFFKKKHFLASGGVNSCKCCCHANMPSSYDWSGVMQLFFLHADDFYHLGVASKSLALEELEGVCSSLQALSLLAQSLWCFGLGSGCGSDLNGQVKKKWKVIWIPLDSRLVCMNNEMKTTHESQNQANHSLFMKSPVNVPQIMFKKKSFSFQHMNLVYNNSDHWLI